MINQNTLDNSSKEILINIASFLTLSDIPKLRRVCKKMNTALKDFLNYAIYPEDSKDFQKLLKQLDLCLIEISRLDITKHIYQRLEELQVPSWRLNPAGIQNSFFNTRHYLTYNHLKNEITDNSLKNITINYYIISAIFWLAYLASVILGIHCLISNKTIGVVLLMVDVFMTACCFPLVINSCTSNLFTKRLKVLSAKNPLSILKNPPTPGIITALVEKRNIFISYSKMNYQKIISLENELQESITPMEIKEKIKLIRELDETTFDSLRALYNIYGYLTIRNDVMPNIKQQCLIMLQEYAEEIKVIRASHNSETLPEDIQFIINLLKTKSEQQVIEIKETADIKQSSERDPLIPKDFKI